MREILSLLLLRELNDPRLALTSITGVELSPDLKNARVFVSVLESGDSAALEQGRRGALAALAKSSGLLRGYLGKQMRLKFVPQLVFEIDHSYEHGARIDALLRDVGE